MKDKLLEIILWVSGLFLLLALILMAYEGNRQNKENILADKEHNKCLIRTKDEQKQFILDCVKSLGVEEQAYVVDTCAEKAEDIICPR